MTHESPVYPTRLTTRPRHSLVPAALALAALALSLHAQAQTPEWVWMGGSSTSPHFLGCNPGAYGNMGSPAPDNIPGGRTPAATWVDKGGNFWLFGGNGCNSAGVVNNLNDLWEFSPTTLEWTWQGVTTTGPADRSSTATWTDSSGNLWLFGGVDPTSSTNLNDLWEFSPSTLDWTLIGMSGSTGVYGNLGTPNAANFPGARSGAANWTDTSGNLWLFGGNGVDSAGTKGNLNDLLGVQPFHARMDLGGRQQHRRPAGSLRNSRHSVGDQHSRRSTAGGQLDRQQRQFLAVREQQSQRPLGI